MLHHSLHSYPCGLCSHMPLAETHVADARKRKLCNCDDSIPDPLPQSAKRRKQEETPRHQTPSWFWDNLSRQWLCPRALREFDRRTSRLPTPSHPKVQKPIEYRPIDLKRFARHGGPSLGNLRAYPEPASERTDPAMSGSQSNSRSRLKPSSTLNKSRRTGTRKTSAYDPGFEQHLEDHGIYPEGYDDEEPSNLEEIGRRLVQPRRSLSPSRFTRDAFLNFKQLNREAQSETSVMNKPFRIITGDNDIPSEEDVFFGNLADLTDGSITKATPNFYDGVCPADVDPRVREELGLYIVPSTNKSALCLPNFFAEGKGPSGNAAVGKRQACYDGALGARAMHKLRSYVDPSTTFDNNAYIITSTYNGGGGGGGGGVLTLYLTNAIESENPEKPVEYRMTQLDSWSMTGNFNTFRQGVGALRNARDWAKEQREGLLASAAARQPSVDMSTSQISSQNVISQSTRTDHPHSDTSEDELAPDLPANAGFASTTSSTAQGGR